MGEKLFGFQRLCLLLVFGLSGCVSLPRSFHALSYKNQTVYLDRNHFYKVGPLSDDWKITLGKYPGIVFKNRVNEATVVIEAICGGGFEDLSLGLLTQNLVAGLGAIQKLKKENWQLSGRDALHTLAHVTLDGIAVSLDIVILKKGGCEFDFYAISLPQYEAEVSRDFETFVKGFDY